MTSNLNPVPVEPCEDDIEYRLEEFRIKNAKRKVRRPLIVALVTLSVIFGTYVGYGHFSYSNEKLFDSYYKTYSTKGDKSCKYLQAIKAYEDKEFSEAILLFNKLTVNDNAHIQYSFYLAISLIECGQYQEAIATLEGIAADKKNEYCEKANWYMGLCYLKVYDNKKAKNHFQLVVQADEDNKDCALNILKDMDR